MTGAIRRLTTGRYVAPAWGNEMRPCPCAAYARTLAPPDLRTLAPPDLRTLAPSHLRTLGPRTVPVLLHAIVLRTTATLRRYPGDDGVRIHDVARLAMDAIRRVDLKTGCAVGVAGDLVDIRRAEPRARVPVFGSADGAAHLGMHQQVRRLILFVRSAGVVHVRHFVEREPPVDDVRVTRLFRR